MSPTREERLRLAEAHLDRLAVRISHVDVRGPWPLSALLSQELVFDQSVMGALRGLVLSGGVGDR